MSTVYSSSNAVFHKTEICCREKLFSTMRANRISAKNRSCRCFFSFINSARFYLRCVKELSALILRATCHQQNTPLSLSISGI
jgi:hypothetical protein